MAGPELRTPGHRRSRLRRPVVDLLIGAMVDVVERDVSNPKHTQVLKQSSTLEQDPNGERRMGN